MTEEPSDVLGSEDWGKPPGRLRAGQAMARGIRLRCPSCGKSPLFRTWFRMWETCGECGLKFERAPGYFLGSTYINYGVTALLTTIVFVVLRFGFGVPREVILPGSLAFCLIFPLVFFRFARSLWLSIDLSLDWQRSEDSGM